MICINSFTISELLTSNSLDLKRGKNPRKQPTFFSFTSRFSETTAKSFGFKQKKNLVVPKDFFHVLNQVH